jgi:acyl-CoA synthetase (NDP forming)
MHEHLGRGLREIDKPGFLVTYTSGTLTLQARRHVAAAGLPYLACGMDQALAALAKSWEWGTSLARPLHAPNPTVSPIPDRPCSELSTLELLSRYGVPTVPHVLAATTDAAVRAARLWEQPVALKVASAEIGHKSEIGGVVLNVRGDSAVAVAFEKVTSAGRAQPGATVEGAIVSPMRIGGIELFVGCSLDATWGPVIAVGLGGIWVEVLEDVVVRPLPVAGAEVADMLRSLRGARLLSGERGTAPVDLGAVGEAIAKIGDVAMALGPDLVALEVNPLWVRAGEVEALDGLAIWAS